MTSLKVKFRPSTIEGKEGIIYYQIIHNRVIRQLRTTYKIFSEEWDDLLSQVVLSIYREDRTSHILTIKESIKMDLKRLSKIIELLNNAGTYTCEDVISAFEMSIKGEMLFNYMQKMVNRLIQLRKYRTSETYKTTLNSFIRFRKGENIMITDISSDLIMDYEAYLKGEGLTMNTVSFYMRILRAVYNRAAEDDLVEQKFPFKKVYTGVDKTIKRALPLKDIKRIKELDLSLAPELIFARDMFLFSFYTRGMSFVDMAYLQKKDLVNGVITYRRRKTGQLLHIKWECCMQKILNLYPPLETKYLLPIIRDKDKNDRAQYINALNKVNNKLKKIGEMIGLTMPLTQYVARHSWASVAKSKHIPIAVISEGMGHDS